MIGFFRLCYLLLERIAVALEEQAAYSARISEAYRLRDEREEQDSAVSNAYAQRQQAITDEIATNQRKMLDSYTRHIADCERWHKQAAGVPVETESEN